MQRFASFACALLLLSPVAASAATPSPKPASTTSADVFITNPAAATDAFARSGGDDRADARLIAARLYAHIEPAQILKVSVDRDASHLVAGLLISGVKFHGTLTRAGFLDEMARICAEAFAAAPIEEVDITTTVPVSVGRGAVVSGEFAQPTSLTVFTATVARGESPAALRARLDRGDGIYWNAWFRDGFAAHR